MICRDRTDTNGGSRETPVIPEYFNRESALRGRPLQYVTGFFFGLALIFNACSAARYITQDSYVRDSGGKITVISSAPLPAEVSDKTRSMSLARDAAITLGQTSLLTYVLLKKTKSGKTLAEAEIPYIKTQREIRGVVQGAGIVKTTYEEDLCTVTISISRAQVNEILRKN